VQVQQQMLHETVVQVEAAGPDQHGRQQGLAPAAQPVLGRLPDPQRSPDQDRRADEVEHPVAQDAPVLVRSPVKGVPLQELVEDGLVEGAGDPDAEQDARQQDRALSSRTTPARRRGRRPAHRSQRPQRRIAGPRSWRTGPTCAPRQRSAQARRGAGMPAGPATSRSAISPVATA
jgi:hypothetical protein